MYLWTDKNFYHNRTVTSSVHKDFCDTTLITVEQSLQKEKKYILRAIISYKRDAFFSLNLRCLKNITSTLQWMDIERGSGTILIYAINIDRSELSAYIANECMIGSDVYALSLFLKIPKIFNCPFREITNISEANACDLERNHRAPLLRDTYYRYKDESVISRRARLSESASTA